MFEGHFEPVKVFRDAFEVEDGRRRKARDCYATGAEESEERC